MNNEDIGGNLGGPGSLLGSLPSAPYGYAVGGGGLEWALDASEKDIAAGLWRGKERSLHRAGLQGAARSK